MHHFLKLIFGIKLYLFRSVPLFHHQEFFTVHTAMVYAIQVCCVYSKKLLMMEQRNCPKHVEFYSKNKFVGFIIIIHMICLNAMVSAVYQKESCVG